MGLGLASLLTEPETLSLAQAENHMQRPAVVAPIMDSARRLAVDGGDLRTVRAGQRPAQAVHSIAEAPREKIAIDRADHIKRLPCPAVGQLAQFRQVFDSGRRSLPLPGAPSRLRSAVL